MSSPDSGTPRHHRPVPYADLAKLIDAATDGTDTSRAEVAATTAALVVAAGRERGAEGQLVDLADTVGIDTLAELWRHADAVSLAGVLWVMYVLRQWCRTQAEEVALLWRAGAPYAPADAVVAGVADGADPESVRRVADDVLNGAYGGDFAVALERAAAFFRVIAAGRRETAGTDLEQRTAQLTLADRNDRTAADLRTSAAFWRAGQLH
ncbi:hypothetical protein [Jatrophihabitans sp. GAS493]|uniref:hypothetical protein n=1 Tax=Jatrophihabitans sp. GAS493 TaxID=1907575 RepID=UPI0012FE4B89|nr:hypothetical protein [Jatrophihabitans sp. GAS493]